MLRPRASRGVVIVVRGHGGHPFTQVFNATRAYGAYLRPSVASWTVAETRRRARLRTSGGWCTTVLLSYPRSGNHLVRNFSEYAFSRPTLGEGDSERWLMPHGIWDRPIYLRSGMDQQVTSPDPILVKRHHLQDIENFQQLILLARDPREAIVRNLDSLSDEQFERAYLDDVQLWAWQVRVFSSWARPQRLLVDHDQLAAAQAEPFLSIAEFLGHPDPQAAASGFLGSHWARSFDALQDAAASREKPRDYWQQTRPDRAAMVTEALRAQALPALGDAWQWLAS